MNDAARENARHATVLDQEGRHLGRIYAEALQAAAEQRGQGDDILGELDALVGDAFVQSPALETYLGSRAVSQEDKEAALRKALSGRCSDLFLDYLLVLNRHDRLDQLRAVHQTYRDLRDRRNKRARVAVRTAVALADDQRQRLADELRADLGQEPILDVTVDPSLLGGLVVQVGDRVYDSSVRTQLDSIRNQLLAGSSHALQRG